MPFILRRTSLPSLAEITAVPQIVIIDQTGPVIPIGEGPGVVCVVGEFVKGAFAPQEPGSAGMVTSLYGGVVYPYFSQGATGIQDGSQVAYNGNGLLELVGLQFKRLAITRVDTEAVTADGGATRGQLTVTVTIAAADQNAGLTTRDILVPAGLRFGSSATFAASTRAFALSGDTLIPKGSTVTANTVVVTINCIPLKVVEPVVATPAASVTFVIDGVLDNVSAGTSITAVNNATNLWPPGTGTTLALRITSRYQLALDQTKPGNSDLTGDITAVWCARRASVIRIATVQNAVDSSEVGRGRIACVSAEPSASASAVDALAAKTAALALASTDSYAQPADRTIITFPHHKVNVADLGNVKIQRGTAGVMAATLSNFPNEANPGASNEFIQGGIVELEDAFIANPLSKTDYVNLLAAGVSPLQKDRTLGWWFVDGVTAAPRATFPTRYTIKRRRMADEIQDSIAQIAAPFVKEPATTERVDAFVAEVIMYLTGLKSPTNPSAQRIVDFAVDEVSGNTLDLLALGIYTLIVKVRILSTMDEIVLQTSIGETVKIPQAA